jgi:hypothetical protein
VRNASCTLIKLGFSDGEGGPAASQLENSRPALAMTRGGRRKSRIMAEPAVLTHSRPVV